MELFRKAKSIRLKSHHDKYLLVESDGESVLQDRNETIKKGIWMVEFVEGFDNVLRLKSSYGKYLTASEDQGNDPPAAKNEGMMVYYTVVDDDGNVDDGYKETSFAFKGHGLEDLTMNLEEQTWIDDIIVCSRNPLNGNLFPLRLALPPKQLRL
ncbi:unnamed protein product [Lactuca virosa]|uniref:DUF569 domain-containing protein n=1 Tax=Lactuca virosa TaxID=75947 RepID=A0AAU9MRS4_9ASTR|nr:unnamed protein product [Lactuca virosa]